jgi:ATP-dependent helicase/nuclease subunit A
MREVPFAMELDGSILEGYIDLVVETPAGIEIVDWKTDQISEGEVEARMEDYRLQAGLYVVGLEAATGRPVSKVTYVFATPRIEREFKEPAALAASARAALTAAINPEPVPPPDAVETQQRLF